MKKRSYLDTEAESVQVYSKKGSYLVADEDDSIREYNLLPEEYDMFSEIDPAFFVRKDTKQFELIANCLTYMKKCLIDFYNRHGIVCILPKLKDSKDDEDTITFSMALSGFRAFMSFEGDNGDYDAYFGVVSRADEDSISSETKRLTIDNYETAIELFLRVIILCS